MMQRCSHILKLLDSAASIKVVSEDGGGTNVDSDRIVPGLPRDDENNTAALPPLPQLRWDRLAEGGRKVKVEVAGRGHCHVNDWYAHVSCSLPHQRRDVRQGQRLPDRTKCQRFLANATTGPRSRRQSGATSWGWTRPVSRSISLDTRRPMILVRLLAIQLNSCDSRSHLWS